MSTTLMSLETLQFLLQHMDANRRFEIFQRCPALRNFEKPVPLRINSLMFTQGCIKVNDTAYSLSIIRKYNAGQVPPHHPEFENNRGVRYEVDKYGFEDFSDETRLTPGDVEIRGQGIFAPIRDHIDVEASIRILENRIQYYETQLAARLERRPNRSRSVIDRMRKTIEINRARLLDYQCRRDNIPPNYEHFLQLTISRTVDEREQKIVQRYAHNKKYSDAVKHLTTVLLGGRSSPICVEKMQLLFVQGVIRLPVGLNFKIEQLKFSGAVGTTLEAVAPILHESSFPLKKLDIKDLTVEDVTNSIVTTARCLKVRMILRNNLQAILTLTNPVVYVSLSLSEQYLEQFVLHWIESERPNGFDYIFDHYCEPLYANEMEDILRRLNCVTIDDENVVIPMNLSARLKVSYGPFPEFAPCSRTNLQYNVYNLNVSGNPPIPATIYGCKPTVNDTSYSLSIIRKYNAGKVPAHHFEFGNNRGVQYEVDKYGFEDFSDETRLTPGDVEIRGQGIFAPIRDHIDNKKYSDAVKHLTTVLLGGRSSSICVEKMQLLFVRGVIRLPVGLNFKIEQLMFSGAVGTTLEAVAPILHKSSFPLKKLVINVLSVEDVTNPIVTTAKCLGIKVIMNVRNNLQAIFTITNPVVHANLQLSEENVEQFILVWIKSERPIGSEFIFHHYSEPGFANEMEDILRRLNGVAIEDENVVIPMNNVSQLKVSYGSFPEFAPCSRWAVRFLTEAIEH
ncbi:unnamed protein product [Caenorhabditis brenneri]